MPSPTETHTHDDDVDAEGVPLDHANPEHPEHATKKREDELQDEALEESFPASDPPSAKHIT